MIILSVGELFSIFPGLLSGVPTRPRGRYVSGRSFFSQERVTTANNFGAPGSGKTRFVYDKVFRAVPRAAEKTKSDGPARGSRELVARAGNRREHVPNPRTAARTPLFQFSKWVSFPTPRVRRRKEGRKFPYKAGNAQKRRRHAHHSPLRYLDRWKSILPWRVPSHISLSTESAFFPPLYSRRVPEIAFRFRIARVPSTAAATVRETKCDSDEQEKKNHFNHVIIHAPCPARSVTAVESNTKKSVARKILWYCSTSKDSISLDKLMSFLKSVKLKQLSVKKQKDCS